MRRIAGPGHVGNAFVDYDPPGTPNGTVFTEAWGNDVQNELRGIEGEFAIPEAAGTNEYVRAAIVGTAIRYGKPLGEVFDMLDYQAPVEFDRDNPTDFFPAFCISTIDNSETLSATNWPDLVPYLRGVLLTYLKGKTGEKSAFDVTNWDITASVATLTLANTTAENKILAALAEDNLVHGGYSNWRTITLASAIGNVAAGTYEITDVDPLTREIQFASAGSAGSGAVTATCQFYHFRIAGSTTTARVFERAAGALIAAGDADGEVIAGLRRRDRGQQITGQITQIARGGPAVPVSDGALKYTEIGNSGYGNGAQGGRGSIDFDSANSPNARTGATTDPRAMGAHLYIWGRSYAA